MYNLLDYLGDLGGLKEIIFFFGALLTQSIVGRLFMSRLMAKTYKIYHYGEDKSLYYQTRWQNGMLTPEEEPTEGEHDTGQQQDLDSKSS